MAGTFRPGDLLTLECVHVADIRPGDVVVYRGPDHQHAPVELVHRIVAVKLEGLVARGDSNPCVDATLVTKDNLLGRVTQLDRDSRMRPVRGGRLGLCRAQILRARLSVWQTIKRLGRRPYRWLRASGVVARYWHPRITKMSFNSDEGPLVKYVYKVRTVARFWPASGRFECQKPYDLVIPRPDRA